MLIPDLGLELLIRILHELNPGLHIQHPITKPLIVECGPENGVIILYMTNLV